VGDRLFTVYLIRNVNHSSMIRMTVLVIFFLSKWDNQFEVWKCID